MGRRCKEKKWEKSWNQICKLLKRQFFAPAYYIWFMLPAAVAAVPVVVGTQRECCRFIWSTAFTWKEMCWDMPIIIISPAVYSSNPHHGRLEYSTPLNATSPTLPPKPMLLPPGSTILPHGPTMLSKIVFFGKVASSCAWFAFEWLCLGSQE